MLAPYGVLQALSRLSFPVLTNQRPGEGEQGEFEEGTEEDLGLQLTGSDETGESGLSLSGTSTLIWRTRSP